MAKTSLITQKVKELKRWILDHPLEFSLVLSVVVLGAFFRLYRIGDYMTFLGDEGRDAIIVRRLLVYADPILIGPGTSIGNMYLGPLYYYLIAPWLLIANFSPVGPSIGVAVLGIITILFIYYVAKEWFGVTAGLIASFLYAISPTVIVYSHSSWNPNIMPFFALLLIYSIYKLEFEKAYKWLPVSAIAFAFALNSHYLALLLGPVAALYWLKTLIDIRNSKSELKQFWIMSTIALGIFLFLMSPLVVFDARHEWRNFSSIEKFFTERQTTVSARPWSSLPKLWPLTEKITTRLIAGKDQFVGRWTAISIMAVLMWLAGLYNARLTRKEKYSYVLLVIWLGISLIGLGIYKQEIYDHYYGFFFPAPFLLLGGMAQHIINRHRIRGSWIVITGLAFLTFVNIDENPFKYAPNMQLTRSVEVAKKIELESRGEPFNLAVIAERNYEDAYQYFLERDRAKVVDIDPQRANETITNQLFVVCELPPEKCDPTHNAKAEVANFGWSKIEDTWEVMGVTLFKLTHTQ